MRDLDTITGARCLTRGPDGGHWQVMVRGAFLNVIASDGLGWDHLSVSLNHRTPNWHELEYVKRLFFKDDEVAMQLHLPPIDHISVHPYVLHIWRPQDRAIPLPPKAMVA